MNCYCCSDKASHAVHLEKWKPVCKFHYTECVEEETGGVMVRTIENHEEAKRNEMQRSIKSA